MSIDTSLFSLVDLTQLVEEEYGFSLDFEVLGNFIAWVATAPDGHDSGSLPTLREALQWAVGYHETHSAPCAVGSCKAQGVIMVDSLWLCRHCKAAYDLGKGRRAVQHARTKFEARKVTNTDPPMGCEVIVFRRMPGVSFIPGSWETEMRVKRAYSDEEVWVDASGRFWPRPEYYMPMPPRPQQDTGAKEASHG